MFEVDGCLPQIVVFRSLRGPDLYFEAALLQILEEKVILVDLEEELWLQVASASLGQLGTLGVVVVEVDCGKNQRVGRVAEPRDGLDDRLQNSDLPQVEVEVVGAIGDVDILLWEDGGVALVDNTLLRWWGFRLADCGNCLLFLQFDEFLSFPEFILKISYSCLVVDILFSQFLFLKN